jgi:endonuclease YncB( thermonuclease family)
MEDNIKIGLSGAKYRRLRDELLVLVEEGRSKAVAAANEVLVRCYWEVGKRICQEKGIEKGGAAAQLYDRLAPDLGIGRSALYRAVQFFKAYPAGVPAAPELSRLAWSWHVELLPVPDPEERREYARLAVENSWGRRDLRRAIQRNLVQAVQRGEESALPVEVLERPAPGEHTFRGVVERLVDGDTLIVRIDLGFEVWKSQRLRLHQVNAPELHTPDGEKALQLLARLLKTGQQVVLRTYKVDIYGRYVADIFFGKEIDLVSPAEMVAGGRFLNQELLEAGR